MNKFFKNFFFKGIGLFLLFGISNILFLVGLVIIFGISNQESDYNNRVEFKDIEAAINGTEEQRDKVRKRLEEQDSFYLLIDPDGNVINEEFLPKELNHSYSRAEIASFTRWYLEDYPVNTKILDDGSILVVGFPKNSVVKLSLTSSFQSFLQSVYLFPIILVLNFILFLLLFRKQQRKAQQEVEPVINGIENLAKGKKVKLEETGQLKTVKEELNKASNLLLEREKGRADWISGVSHDIRTPLASIMTASELIERSEQNGKYVDRIKRNVTKLRKLAQNLNLSNKLQHGLAPVKKEHLNIAHLLRENVIEFIDENNIEPELVNLKVEECLVDVDPVLFERLIQNLLDNWYSHNEEGTEINIICLKNVNVYNLKVQNPVSSGENRESSRDHLGLGLTLVRQICKLQDWELRLTKDSEFEAVVTIPVKEEPKTV